MRKRLWWPISLIALSVLHVAAQTIPEDLPPEVRAQLERALRERQAAGRTATEATAVAPARQATPPPTPAPEVEVAPSPALGRPAPFGLHIFKRVPATFAPLDYGPVDPDYRIGPGDEVLIDTWGEVELHYRPVVDRDGSVTLPIVGQVMVAGLTVDQAQKKLLQALSRYHESLRPGPRGARSFLSVSLGKLRPITVFVLGEVVRPGAYTLDAAATAFQALYAAGGPTERGSLRHICRYGADGAADTLDGYDYLIYGDRTNDIRLHHKDVVFLPVIGRAVEVRGAVKRPALYELRPGESVTDLLAFAGGLRADATPELSQIERIVGTERRLFDVSLADSATIELRDGDVLTIGAALRQVTKTVTVRGRVKRAQDYGWRSGLTVSELMRWTGGPMEDAYLERADLIRLRPDRTTEVHPVNLEAILGGQRDADVALMPYDTLVVRSKYDFLPPEIVTIHGEVRAPGEYPYRQDMSLADLFFAAKGLTPAAYTREVTILRQYLTAGQILTDTLRILLPAQVEEIRPPRWPQVPLMPNDQVFVRRRPDWTAPMLVTVAGEVAFPGNYQLRTRSERLLEVIERAGGLTENAYLPGVTVTRLSIGRIAVDLERARAEPDGYENLMLFPGDVVHVPKIPQTVTIKGAVGLETSVVYVPGKRVGYYLDLAGGVLDSADVERTMLVLYGGRVEKARKWFRWEKVPPGSTIIVPTKRMRPPTDWGETVRDAVTFIGSLATTALLIIQVMRQ